VTDRGLSTGYRSAGFFLSAGYLSHLNHHGASVPRIFVPRLRPERVQAGILSIRALDCRFRGDSVFVVCAVVLRVEFLVQCSEKITVRGFNHEKLQIELSLAGSCSVTAAGRVFRR
ncbi:MAG TPA: hypothetical protein PKI71_08240, partial [Candidatus Rifleibacterium sp.]|nr:hypothetical protein [Candidatus Rifleibacterium sp.]